MAAAKKARRRRVAVIGGGPAGLAAGRYLSEFGHTPVIFEAGSAVGGIWAPEPVNKVVYQGLVTNIPTVCMQSFDLDFEPQLSSYIRASELGSYLARYAKYFDLHRHVRFGCRVTNVRSCGSEEVSEEWEVSWRSGVHDESDIFDAVVVATGHYDTPYLPEIPGQSEWLKASSSRSIVHAIGYDDPAEFSGRSVLVVGGRSSGVDIARELRDKVAWLYVLESGCQKVTSVGNSTHVPLGAELTAAGTLQLASQALPGPAVDVVILATGYTYAFPFLDEASLGLDFGPARRYVAPLYQHVIHAKQPNLCFLGLPLAVPCPVALFEAQARLVSAHLSQGWSTEAQRHEWVTKRFESVAHRPQDFHFLGNEAWDYMRALVSEAGMPADEFDKYSRRVSVIRAVHEDRGSKRPDMPWDDDWYRQCEYSVDYDQGTFEVMMPQSRH